MSEFIKSIRIGSKRYDIFGNDNSAYIDSSLAKDITNQLSKSITDEILIANKMYIDTQFSKYRTDEFDSLTFMMQMEKERQLQSRIIERDAERLESISERYIDQEVNKMMEERLDKLAKQEITRSAANVLIDDYNDSYYSYFESPLAYIRDVEPREEISYWKDKLMQKYKGNKK